MNTLLSRTILFSNTQCNLQSILFSRKISIYKLAFLLIPFFCKNAERDANHTLRERATLLRILSSVMFFLFSFFLAACRRNRRVFARVSNSLACSASISAIESVPAHSMRDQLLLPRALNGDNGATSKVGNQMAGKRRGAIESRLPYKCRAQLPVKITRSLISSRGKSKSRAVRNKSFPFA